MFLLLFHLALIGFTTGDLPDYQAYPCPDQCLCLSEIQVLCNTGQLAVFPSSIPNVTQDLSITNQDISILPKYAFKGLKSLKKITLDHNKITTIEPFAFKGLQNMEEISLRWNPLETISGFAFAGIRNISHIYLGYNKIKTISGYAFAGSEYIDMMVLNDNPNIKTIESFAFAGLKFVKFLLLSSSVKHIHADAFNGLESVEQLKIEYLNLKRTVANTFRGLTKCKVLTIDNSDLGVVEAGAWSGMVGVHQVNILSSKIDEITDISIVEGSDVKVLRLSENHVLSMSPDMEIDRLGAAGHLETLHLNRNYLPCSCSLANVIYLLEGLVNLDTLHNENYCLSPHNMNGNTLKQMETICAQTDQLTHSPQLVQGERSQSTNSGGKQSGTRRKTKGSELSSKIYQKERSSGTPSSYTSPLSQPLAALPFLLPYLLY